MTQAVTSAELIYDLGKSVLRYNAEGYKIGLFKNDVSPTSLTVLADLTAANFGGYAGLQNITSWSAGTIVYTAPRAVAEHPAVTWTASGTTTNTIYGYYVVDGGGALAWAERRDGVGVVVGSVSGQTYVVVPVRSRRSEFHST